ncbi:hypothetical protein HYZ99_03435 [Candidatus Peregrinibacteria bacterium]|nr:hypothetical protein [Candidatus Peregrinibacteria bacterium]
MKLFEATERMWTQQAQQTVKGDPVLALVELITNCDEHGYMKMEEEDHPVTGNIFVHVASRKGPETVYEVYDQARGMDARDMLEKITLIGDASNGLTVSSGGRSFFGRGLKECMIAFGKAEVRSIKDGMHYKCSSLGAHVSMKPETRKATASDYEELQIPRGGNGTRIRLFAVNDTFHRTPQFRKLSHTLSHHYSLRDILANSNRHITLRYITLGTRGGWRVKEEEKLAYSFPGGEKILEKEVSVEGYPSALVKIEVCKSAKEIPESDQKYSEERGFLVCSKHAIHDIHDFGFKNHEAAGYLFGRVYCEYFDQLLRDKDDATWLHESRDGVRWSYHPFAKSLAKTVTKELKGLYEKESERHSKNEKQYENEETKRRVREALAMLNQVAREEFAVEGEGPGIKKEIVIKRVPNGMAFMPPFVRMEVAKDRSVTLKVELEGGITSKSVVELKSSNPEVVVANAELKISDFMSSKVVYEGNIGEQNVEIVTLKPKLKSEVVGAQGVITAKCEDREAQLEVVVQEEGKRDSGGDRRNTGGLFRDYKFDKYAEPKQRVRYVSATGIVVIATQAPSLIRYFGPEGENQNEPEARSLLAELILDACCAELVRLKMSQEGLFSIDDEPAYVSEMFNFELSQWKNRLAEPLHKIIAGK